MRESKHTSKTRPKHKHKMCKAMNVTGANIWICLQRGLLSPFEKLCSIAVWFLHSSSSINTWKMANSLVMTSGNPRILEANWMRHYNVKKQGCLLNDSETCKLRAVGCSADANISRLFFYYYYYYHFPTPQKMLTRDRDGYRQGYLVRHGANAVPSTVFRMSWV